MPGNDLFKRPMIIVFADDPPLPVRVVLNQINPLLQGKDYSRAVERLLAFQSQGGPAPAPGAADPKGYHHPEIYYALGNCYLLQEQFKPAAYRQAVARDPGHIYGSWPAFIPATSRFSGRKSCSTNTSNWG